MDEKNEIANIAQIMAGGFGNRALLNKSVRNLRNPDISASSGLTLLMHLAKGGDTDFSAVILKKGINVNARNGYGITATSYLSFA
ncbi:MAG: hypothetical protein IIC13_13900 [SAR324 cluster bacterium]|nr:hypothetical protein [SAR324 cluster bacterium]